MRISSQPLLQRIDRFLYSPAFFLLLGVMTVLSNVFGMEFFSYTCFVFVACCICLFGRDLLPLMPMFVCGYISPYMQNNPGFNDQSVFSLAGGGLYLIGLVAVFLCCGKFEHLELIVYLKYLRDLQNLRNVIYICFCTCKIIIIMLQLLLIE